MLWVVSRVSRWLLHWQIVMWCNVCAMFSCKPEIVHVCCCGSLIVGPKSQALNSHCGRFPRSYCRSRFQRLSSQSVQKQRDEWTPSTTCCLDEVDLYTIYSLMYVIVYIYIHVTYGAYALIFVVGLAGHRGIVQCSSLQAVHVLQGL